jgi:hypothetical protein
VDELEGTGFRCAPFPGCYDEDMISGKNAVALIGSVVGWSRAFVNLSSWILTFRVKPSSTHYLKGVMSMIKIKKVCDKHRWAQPKQAWS